MHIVTPNLEDKNVEDYYYKPHEFFNPSLMKNLYEYT